MHRKMQIMKIFSIHAKANHCRQAIHASKDANYEIYFNSRQSKSLPQGKLSSTKKASPLELVFLLWLISQKPIISAHPIWKKVNIWHCGSHTICT